MAAMVLNVCQQRVRHWQQPQGYRIGCDPVWRLDRQMGIANAPDAGNFCGSDLQGNDGVIFTRWRPGRLGNNAARL